MFQWRLLLFKFSFSSLHNLVRTMQVLLEYISNLSVFVVSCSWRTDVTWLADASLPSSAITCSSNLTMCQQFVYCYLLLLDYNVWGCMVSTVWHLCCCCFCFSSKFNYCSIIVGVIFLLQGGSWLAILIFHSS